MAFTVGLLIHLYGVVIVIILFMPEPSIWKQSNFQCQEDEVLMFSPIDHDHHKKLDDLWCVNIEEVK